MSTPAEGVGTHRADSRRAVARGLFWGVGIGVVSGWTLGLSLIGLHPWWHAGLYTLGMALLLLLAWLARNRLAVQAVLLLASFAAPALLAGLRSPQALVFGIGMLLPLTVVQLVVLLTAGAGKSRAR